MIEPSRRSALRAAALVALSVAFVPSISVAHTDAGFMVDIDHPVLRATPAPGVVLLLFSLHNNTSDKLNLLRVEGGIPGRTAIMARVGAGRVVLLPALSIPPFETVHFTGLDLWIEFRGISEPLKPKQEVGFRLIFADGRWADIVAVVDGGANDDH